MAPKNNKLSEAQILRDTKLLKNFLFDLINKPYNDLVTISRIFSYKGGNQDQEGNFIFDFNRLTKLELVNIILESIIETAERNKDHFIERSRFCRILKSKLCHTKYIFLKPCGTFDSRAFAGNLASMFTEDLYNKLIQVAKRDECILKIEEIIKRTKFVNGDFLRESSDTKPVFLGFVGRTVETRDSIYFVTFKGKSKTKRIIRPSDLKI